MAGLADVMFLLTSSISAIGSMVTLALAVLLPGFGSPCVVELTLTLGGLVNVPAAKGRLTGTEKLTESPDLSSVPLAWVQVMVEEFKMPADGQL